jgi:hypothetical protein
MINADAKLKEVFGKPQVLDVRDGWPDRQARQVILGHCPTDESRPMAGFLPDVCHRRCAIAPPMP